MQAVGAKSGAALAIAPRSATGPRMLFTGQPPERNSTEKRTEIIDYFLFARHSGEITAYPKMQSKLARHRLERLRIAMSDTCSKSG